MHVGPSEDSQEKSSPESFRAIYNRGKNGRFRRPEWGDLGRVVDDPEAHVVSILVDLEADGR